MYGTCRISITGFDNIIIARVSGQGRCPGRLCHGVSGQGRRPGRLCHGVSGQGRRPGRPCRHGVSGQVRVRVRVSI